jgi:protoporphyrinogen oxidase
MKTVYDCIVIGGGVSGISFAHHLHRAGKKALVLERESRAGGRIQTVTLPGTGLWYEMGAHTCYNVYASLLSVIGELNAAGSIRTPDGYPYRILMNGKLKRMSAGLSMGTLLLNCPRVFFTDKREKTVEEYYRRIVGGSNYERLFSKAFRAVISQPAGEYPAELLLKKRKVRLKEFPRKFTFAQGLSSMIEDVIAKDRLVLETSATATAIHLLAGEDKPVYRVETQTGDKRYALSVAIAVDPPSAARLLGNVEPALAELLSSIPVFRSESLGVVVRREALSVERMAGIIPLNDDFLSSVSGDVRDHPAFRCFTFHFEQGAKSHDEQMETVCKTLHVRRDDVAAWTAANHVLPSLRVQHLNMQQQAAARRTNAGIYLLGNYFTGVSIEDCMSRSREEFARFKAGTGNQELPENKGNHFPITGTSLQTA